MKPARILLVDDHDLFRAGLLGLINAQPDLEVVGEAGDGLEALKLARDLEPDLVVMDINMPVCDGLEATRLICSKLPNTRVLILTVHDEEEKLFAAIKAGAIGYLLKSTNKTKFLRGLRAVLAGEAALPPKLAARILEEFARLMKQAVIGNHSEEIADLTRREMEVLKHVTQEASDKEIAELLSISIHTVKSHVRSLLGKLHAVNRREAARIATQQGLLNSHDNQTL